MGDRFGLGLGLRRDGRRLLHGFTLLALQGLGATITSTPTGFSANTSVVPVGLRDALPPKQPLAFQRDLPAPRGVALLARTDPQVESIARFVLDLALDGNSSDRPASRAGVMRTASVSQRTTLLVVRFRFHLTLPGKRELVVEDARSFAFTGTPAEAIWLTPQAVAQFDNATAAGNIPADQAISMFERTVAGLGAVCDHLEAEANRLAIELADAHGRVRAAAKNSVSGIAAKAELPVDILGAYLYMPVVTA